MFPVEAFQNTLQKFVAIAEKHKVRFHLTGGVTSSQYGEPRMTQDVDIVVDPQRLQLVLDDVLDSLQTSDFLFNPGSIHEAASAGRQFQLLDEKELLKLAIYPRELIDGELERSESVEIFEGVWLPIASRVDAAMSKLIWIERGSHKSRNDLKQLYSNATPAQQNLMQESARALELRGLLDEVIADVNLP